MAALSNRFVERRGFALSVYGVGGNVGEILGPATTGLLLGMLTWQSIISTYALLPLLMMFPVFWAFRDIGGRQPDSPARLRSQAGCRTSSVYTRQMLRNTVLWGIIAVAGLRGMAFVAFTAVIALYAKDVLDLSDQTRGFYFSLLGLVGMAASPVLGHLSDRFGRKTVLVPNLLALGVLTLLMGWYGHLGAFPVLLVLMGVFLYSDQPVLTAAALDVAGRRTTTTAIGFVSFSRLALERSFSGDCGVAVPSRGRAGGVLLHRGTLLPGRLRSLSAPLAQGLTGRIGPDKTMTLISGGPDGQDL